MRRRAAPPSTAVFASTRPPAASCLGRVTAVRPIPMTPFPSPTRRLNPCLWPLADPTISRAYTVGETPTQNTVGPGRRPSCGGLQLPFLNTLWSPPPPKPLAARVALSLITHQDYPRPGRSRNPPHPLAQCVRPMRISPLLTALLTWRAARATDDSHHPRAFHSRGADCFSPAAVIFRPMFFPYLNSRWFILAINYSQECRRERGGGWCRKLWSLVARGVRTRGARA